MRLSDEEYTAIEDLAGCNYAPEKIALYLDVDKKEFMKLWFDRTSLVRTAYDRGQLQAEFEVNKQQKLLAQAGNITAAQIFLKESKEQEAKNNLYNILFGSDYED
ncbi:hypothetical protein [Myroides odoratimimus]|uniref:Uncharacterized protein n=1 Tax=Myroides odoratimimus CIP 101113 TaxID=883154 RepID=A0AAV3F5I8_9FLAO|nr:hypothetical protein [Myroides odoratimimus]EHO13819.1 hypothetical protein HMPREF9715_00893 [Myroides odoratimimus CIP 101113]